MSLSIKKIIGCTLVAGLMNNCTAATISCPSQLASNIEKQTQWNNWIVNNPKHSKQKVGSKNTFTSSDILEGIPGDEKKDFPSLLAPDQETKVSERQIIQSWHFKDSNKRFLLVCRYRNSDIYLSMPLPTTISTCKQKLELTNPKSDIPGGAVVKSLDCE